MESAGHVTVPLRGGGKKMRKRRELDALVAHSIAKRACNSGKRNIAGNGINSQDQLLSQSTDDQEDYTWPKVRNSSRCRTKRLSCLKTCGPFVLITCVFMSFGFMYWLYFDLRQQINEYRMRIEQVSASSQNIPEAFQKWHETSKNLEQNQTILLNGIAEIREVLKNFSLDLNHLKDNINKEAETSKESQISVLQSDIAGFGATIKDFKSNFAKITNEKLPKLQNDIQLNKESFTNLTKLITTQLNTTNLTSISTSIDPTHLIDELKVSLLNQITSLNVTVTANLTELNENLNQITESVQKQHASILIYPDKFLELSSKIMSIQTDWTAHKQTIITFEQFAKNITQNLLNLQDLRLTTNNLTSEINKIQNDLKKYNQYNDNVTSEIQAIKENLDRTRNLPNDKSAVIPASAPTSLTPNTIKNESNSVSPSVVPPGDGSSTTVTPISSPTTPSTINILKTTEIQPPPPIGEGKPKLLIVPN